MKRNRIPSINYNPPCSPRVIVKVLTGRLRLPRYDFNTPAQVYLYNHMHSSTQLVSRPRLQIIRGLPGSGKSTLALDRYPNLLRLETDMFFTRGGRYTFTLPLNTRAVKWFNRTVEDTLRTGMDFVVTGVFAAHTERLGKTIEAAQERGYEVWVKTLTSRYGDVHGVPKAHYAAMKRDFLSDRRLRQLHRGIPNLHFGLMPPTAPAVNPA